MLGELQHSQLLPTCMFIFESIQTHRHICMYLPLRIAEHARYRWWSICLPKFASVTMTEFPGSVSTQTSLSMWWICWQLTQYPLLFLTSPQYPTSHNRIVRLVSVWAHLIGSKIQVRQAFLFHLPLLLTLFSVPHILFLLFRRSL